MFYSKVGKMALGSRLRRLSEAITENAKSIYELYGVDLKPKWFPVFYLLSENKAISITDIAKEIGHSHPSVSKIVREMCQEGVTLEQKDKKDGRKNLIVLSQKGIEITVKLKEQCIDVDLAVELALNQSQHNIWTAIEEFEFLLNQKSLFDRVKEQKKKRETKKVIIIPYEAKYHYHFKQFNQAWIQKYFEMEESDNKALNNPKEYILDNGGYIFVALYENKAVGVCALLKINDKEWDFELGKMAVSPEFQGLGIGFLLAKAIIEKAKSLEARSIYLESNTVLAPAIKLYQKLGFEKVSACPTPYQRCNIQMVLKLK